MTKTIKITTRARNLGLGTTSQPVQDHRGFLKIDSVDSPDVVGGLRTIESEWARALRVNSGHDWRAALFVGSAKVVDVGMGPDIGFILANLREFGEAIVEVEVSE